MTLDDIIAKAAEALEFIEGFAVSQHQRTDDEGFAAIARTIGRLKSAVVPALSTPEAMADIAAIKSMAAQDLPSLTTPAAPMPVDAPQPDIQDGVRGGSRGGLMAPGT